MTTSANGGICILAFKAFYSSTFSKSLSSVLTRAALVSSSHVILVSMYSPDSVDGNTDEELCNRWMQLAAFTPFYRNHNVKGAISQEPYRWDSVANASRSAIATRYSLLPYWVRALFLSNHISNRRNAVHPVRKCFHTRNTACPCSIL